jgi:hypothetical protein
VNFLSALSNVLNSVSHALQQSQAKSGLGSISYASLPPAQQQALSSIANQMTAAQQQALRGLLQATPQAQQAPMLSSFLQQQGMPSREASAAATQMLPMLQALAQLPIQPRDTQFGHSQSSTFDATPHGDGVTAPVLGTVNQSGPSLFAKDAPVAAVSDASATTDVSGSPVGGG